MAQYDIPLFQLDANSKFARVTLAPSAARALLAINPTTRVPELYNMACGSISVNANSTATTFGGANTWTQVTVFDTEYSRGVTAAHAADTLTIVEGGTYMVAFTATVSGGAGDNIELEVRKAAGATTLANIHAEVVMGVGGDIVTLSGKGLVVFTAAEAFGLYAQNKTDTTTITIRDSSLIATQIP